MTGRVLNDYYFPAAAPADFFSYSDEDGIHIIEAMVSADLGVASVMGAYNLSGDADNSFWVEGSVPLAALSTDDVEVGVTVEESRGDGSRTSLRVINVTASGPLHL